MCVCAWQVSQQSKPVLSLQPYQSIVYLELAACFASSALLCSCQQGDQLILKRKQTHTHTYMNNSHNSLIHFHAHVDFPTLKQPTASLTAECWVCELSQWPVFYSIELLCEVSSSCLVVWSHSTVIFHTINSGVITSSEPLSVTVLYESKGLHQNFHIIVNF